jgi:hypothetical protein
MKKISFFTMMLMIYSTLLNSQVVINPESSDVSRLAIPEMKLSDSDMRIPLVRKTRYVTFIHPENKMLLQTGNVGVGISTPPSKLSISGDYGVPAIPGTSSAGILRIGIYDDEGIDIGKMGTEPFSGWIQAGYQGTEADPLSLQPLGGNVGIGVASPLIKLQVAGIIGADYGSSTSASYVFGSGVENTGFSSPTPGAIAVIIGGSQKARFVSNGSLGLGTGSPHSSALLDITSTTKGFLPPRMTQVQISAIASPANGLVVFCTTDEKYYGYIASAGVWKEILFGTGTLTNCGTPITINHVTGDVAPVTKTVTYALVNNIPGETSKCWITSNLGSNHQATAVNDATEESAGWYWQFNRKQGYKHDGTTRTPNTTWVIFSEASSWLAANDPCTLELGSDWRIPTHTEYYNIDNMGGWDDWDGPWDSALKLHAAGYLTVDAGIEGSLLARGTTGIYWSRSQITEWVGLSLYFRSTICNISNTNKSAGFTVRCIKE